MIIKSQTINQVPHNTKLIRFLDLNGGEKSVGEVDHNEICTNFHSVHDKKPPRIK